MVSYTYLVTKENAKEGGKMMDSGKDKKGVDWQAVAISFVVSTLSGLLVSYLSKLLGL